MKKLLASPENPLNYKAVKITLVSSEQILEWSHGEVKLQKPSIIALINQKEMVCFVVKFHGPVTDYECICGNIKE